MRQIAFLTVLLFPAIALALELDGHSDFARRIELNSSLSARIASVDVEPGQRVTAGQTLVRLVSTGFAFNVDSARAEAEALLPATAEASSELEKAEELFARDSLAPMDLRRAEQNHAIALARQQAAEARLEHARYLLSQTEIRAPIDGLVLAVDAAAGEYVNTRIENRILVTIADDSTMIAVTQMPWESAKPSLLGRKASIGLRGKTYPGRVIEVGYDARPGNNGHPSVTLRFGFKPGAGIAAGLPLRVSLDAD